MAIRLISGKLPAAEIRDRRDLLLLFRIPDIRISPPFPDLRR